MTEAYRIFGSELSPYSIKVRSYFRYKGIPHEWLIRDPSNIAEYQKHARLPLVPLVITPDDQGIQDSTPILEKLEAAFPEPSIHPDDPAAAFLSALLEEFGDEWGNKWMFHYRWWREADQISASERLASDMAGPDAGSEQLTQVAAMIRERMIPRIGFVGSSEKTQQQIEGSFSGGIALLEAHLQRRAFLFGGRPAFADFGLWGQLYNAHTDPTAGGILDERAPKLVAWLQRMLDPKAEGEWEPLEALLPTLKPLLETQVADLFLPWSAANARAIASGDAEFSVELAGRTWEQAPQKYHARSLKALRDRYAGVSNSGALDPILEETGCLVWLRDS
ncbi:MAG: glutathione S-transferase family protein [Myxococcota bacterium]|nr:glutathione S-transferase family protein [Myxococcota bacterium]